MMMLLVQMVATMINKKLIQCLYLAMACLSLLLASCDGGLFGTGDGTNNNIMIEGEAGSTTDEMDAGENTGSTDGTTTGATDGDTTGETQMSTVDNSMPTTESFDNMLPGGQNAAPQMRVVNLTQLNVQVSVNDNPVINELLPQQDSGRVELPVDAAQLLFSDVATLSMDDSVAFHTIEPFNAAEFSITTIIMRPDDATSNIGFITLTTQSESTSPSTALVRLVQATSLGDVNSSSTITLVATQPNNSGSDVNFEGLSYVTQKTDYADVLPGTYSLTDANNRFASESITIEAGHVYTLVINSNMAPALRAIDDSQ